MGLAVTKLSKATVVDFAAVTTPVLAIGGQGDRIVPAGVVRQTAAKYQHGSYVEIPGSDHTVFSGAALPIATSTVGSLGIPYSPPLPSPRHFMRGMPLPILLF
jgi:pimeloyl-ACP methyl ester carboxylesterase